MYTSSRASGDAGDNGRGRREQSDRSPPALSLPSRQKRCPIGSGMTVSQRQKMPDQVGHDVERAGHDVERVGHDAKEPYNSNFTVVS